MSYYLLPRTYLYTYRHLDYESRSLSTISETYISQSLAHYLYGMKEKINDKDKKWDVYKKYTNPYEYIHTAIPIKKKSIAKHKPLSRSYFKMVEIVSLFSILQKYENTHLRTFHLAEGPGGFIEAIAHLRNNMADQYVGMTLQDADPNVPAWKKTGDFLTEFPNVYLENGRTGTGNILCIENYDAIVEKYSDIDIVTADGGFDFSMDFNQQEMFISKLLFAQTAYAISIQRMGGTFVLKIFDVFMRYTTDILYLLSSLYERVYIVKPQTSRYANSEKYIVCIGFLFDKSADYLQYIRKTLCQMLASDQYQCPSSFLKKPPSHVFLQKMEEYNAIFGQKQMQNIQYTIYLMDNRNKYDKIDALIKTNIKKCMEWCIKYNIPYVCVPTMTNVFTPLTK